VQLAGSAILNANGNKVYDSSGPLYLGTTGTTGHSLATGDVLVGGKLEVDGVLWADGAINAGSGVTLATAAVLTFAAENNYGSFRHQLDDGLHLSLGNTDGQANRNLLIIDSANSTKDHDHDTLSANPTVFIHSATDPDTANTQWLSFAHDQTDGVISTGLGDVVISPAGSDLVIGTGGAGVDYALKVNGETNDGTLTWMEDEAAWTFANPVAHVPQTITCADSTDGNHSACGGAATLTSNVVQLVCNDADGCTLTLAETGYSGTVSGLVTIVGPAANHVDLADSAGVLELDGGAAFAMVALDTLQLVYAPAATAWLEASRHTDL
jgi:hypothetical protein